MEKRVTEVSRSCARGPAVKIGGLSLTSTFFLLRLTSHEIMLEL